MSGRIPFSVGRCPVSVVNRSSVTATYPGSISMPRATRPVCSAAIIDEPLPRNGSRTVAPSPENCRMRSAMSAIGFCVGWTRPRIGSCSVPKTPAHLCRRITRRCFCRDQINSKHDPYILSADSSRRLSHTIHEPVCCVSPSVGA